MMENEKRIIEINGVKIEVDMRTAKRIDEFKVGDTVKVLDNRHNKNEMHTGVITDFAMFKELPTIMVAVYIEFIPFNANAENIEIVGVSQEEIIVSRESIV